MPSKIPLNVIPAKSLPRTPDTGPESREPVGEKAVTISQTGVRYRPSLN